jgi:hypothetical protein
MSGTPYVYERQTEYWTSRQIEDFLLDEGFEVITYPLTAKSEAVVPADFLLFDRGRTKLVGFQYKTLYHNGSDHWELDDQQHADLQRRPWIYYATSELRDPKEFRNALYRVRFYPTAFPYKPELPAGGEKRLYYRWGAFADAFRRCRVGLVVKNLAHLHELLRPSTHHVATRELSEIIPDFSLPIWNSDVLFTTHPY